MYFNSYTNLNPKFTADLDRESTSLDTVLDDPSLPQAIRSGLTVLQSFILRPSNMNLLLDYLFTKKQPLTLNPKKTVRSALSFVTTPNQIISKIFIQSEIFIQRLIKFIDIDSINDPLISSNFQIIIESLSKTTDGEFLQKIPNLHDFLIAHLNQLIFKELYFI